MSDGPTIDLDQTRRFLHALTGEESPAVCWQTFADPAELKEDKALAVSKTLRLAAIEQWLVQVNAKRAGIFVTVNATDGQGRKVENVVGLRALFIDCDGTRELPTAWPLAPSIVVQRDATHWHAYWLLVPGQPRERFTAAQVQLAAHWQTDATVKDLPRVMRVPGFIHHKGSPTAVALRCAHGQLRYSIDQVMAAHPVDWAALCHSRDAIAAAPEAERPALERSAAYWRAAEREGLCGATVTPPAAASSSAPRPAPPANPGPRPQASGADLADDDWQVEQFRKWAAAVDTAAGAANARGGQDNAAFAIACEGYARSDQVGGRFTAGVVDRAVADYLARVGWSNIDAECARICSSARRRGNLSCTLPTRPQRRAHGGAVARAPAERADMGDLFADPPTDPPPPGSGGTGEGGDAKPRPWDGLDLKRLELTWSISPQGVAPIQWDSKAQEYQVKPNNRVSDLPIWPVREGVDAATGDLWWLVAWLTPQGKRSEQWIAEGALKVGHELIALPGGPVTKQHCERCATWLTAARVAVTNEPARVTSRIGWAGHNGDRRWIWPGASGATGAAVYIGGDLKPAGDLAVWRTGVDTLVALPDDDGYPALCVLGFAVGAAFVRLSGRTGARNPVIGLMGPSSSGKSTALNYALSVWGPPDLLTVPAMSTSKGLQDRAAGMPDLPLFVDDLQNLAERDADQASDAVYYLANGQRRVTSSKEQRARGGELRYGVGFYAAEHPILPGMNSGAQFRVAEITRAICPTAEVAKALQRAAAAHGALALPLADHLASRTPGQWKEALDAWGAEWRANGSADYDADVLAILRAGLEAVQAALGIEVGAAAVVQWLSTILRTQRAEAVDRETLALHALLDQVSNGHWTPVEQPKQHQEGRDGQAVAWRETKDLPNAREVADGDALFRVVRLEINTEAEGPRRLLREMGGEQRILTVWKRKGWIIPDGKHLKVKKAHKGQPMGRVLRLTEAALDLYYGHAAARPP